MVPRHLNILKNITLVHSINDNILIELDEQERVESIHLIYVQMAGSKSYEDQGPSI